jgi:hypothetical protein
MANAYTITSITYPNNAADPQVIIAGTVNGVAVSASCWLSVFNQHAASAISFEAFVGPLLLAAYNATLNTTITPIVTSFSQ